MQIEQNNFIPDEGTKNKKIMAIIIALITVIVVAIIAVIFILMGMKSNRLSVVIDGVSTKAPEDTFVFYDDGKIYVSVSDIAPLVGYSSHNGEYKVNVDDINKMYVESKDEKETASFYWNSRTISKVAPNSNLEYENITMSDPAVFINNKLYVVSDGFTIGFNCIFDYNKAKNRITIQTLPALVNYYTKNINQYEFAKISEDFNNQKALIHGMVVGSREDEKFGVKAVDGKEIISPRYKKIQFIESSNDFIITNSSDKVGITYNTGKTKITVSYDDIKVVDSDLGLYLVKSNNKYGMIDSLENFVIHIEYDQIGADISKFPTDNIKNQYILYNNIIPVKINDKWRLLDVKGNRLTNDEYDDIGYINNNSKNRILNNALTIGNTKTIIVAKLINPESKDKVYGGVDVKGNTLIPINFEAIYSITSSGETTYYILNNGKEYNAVDLVNAVKLRMGYTQDEIEPKEEQSVQEQMGSQTTDTNKAENAISNTTTNTVETSVEPTNMNGIMRATNVTGNSVQSNQGDIGQSTQNSTASYIPRIGE